MENRKVVRGYIPLEPMKSASGRMPTGGRGFTEVEVKVFSENGR